MAGVTDQTTLTETSPAVEPGDRVSWLGVTWTVQGISGTMVALDGQVAGQDSQLVSLREIDSLTCDACGVNEVRAFGRSCADCLDD